MASVAQEGLARSLADKVLAGSAYIATLPNVELDTGAAFPFVIACKDEHSMTTSPKSRLPETEALSPERVDQIGEALGHALAQCWSRLPQELQQNIFEAAVNHGGEAMRQSLAIFLHGKHHRTIDSLHARSLPEPDSLGG